MARRSRGERVRAEIRGWMPLDGRRATLLVVAALFVMMIASLLH
jgi:hypothetical protein